MNETQNLLIYELLHRYNHRVRPVDRPNQPVTVRLLLKPYQILEVVGTWGSRTIWGLGPLLGVKGQTSRETFQDELNQCITMSMWMTEVSDLKLLVF